jgi:4a-hydroxytetrahydrobiopterin dehydratase
LLGELQTVVAVADLGAALEAASAVSSAAGVQGAHRLRLDVRADRLLVAVSAPSARLVGPVEVELAQRVSTHLASLGLPLRPELVSPRSLQSLELGIDTMDRSRIRPFWKAVLAYVDEPGDELLNGLVDPLGQGPAIWFQQMDTPRPQRNRIHFDVTVPHDVAESRLAAALAAGGTLLSDKEAPAFWVLADAEGNEACICTWQGRD